MMSGMRDKFVWYDLMTTDLAAAIAFYGDVVGWTAKHAGMPGSDYTILSAGDHGVGGIMTLPKEAREAGARSGWFGYIKVDDVDAAATKVTQLGGTVHRPPTDIPGIGRFAMVSDPQGAVISLFTWFDDGEPPPVAPGTPGQVGWHELYATDLEAAFAFYAEMFGWERGDALDMGPMGNYQLFGLNGSMLGGMMKGPDGSDAPRWQYYFIVEDIDAAKARAESGGGTILVEPHEVPGGAWIIQSLDPQGAHFALVGQRH